MNAWVKKYAVVVSGESVVLVELFDVPKCQSKPKPRKARSRKHHWLKQVKKLRHRIRRRSHRTTNRSDAEGEEDSNKSISDSDNDDYSVNDGPEKNTNSDDDIIGDEEGDHKGKPCNEVDNRDAPDFDRLCKITYMERLYDDILCQHHGHK